MVRFGPAGKVREDFWTDIWRTCWELASCKAENNSSRQRQQWSVCKGLVRGRGAPSSDLWPLGGGGDKGLREHEPGWVPEAGEVREGPDGVRPLMPQSEQIGAVELFLWLHWLLSSLVVPGSISPHLLPHFCLGEGTFFWPAFPADLAIGPFSPSLLHPPSTGLRGTLSLLCESHLSFFFFLFWPPCGVWSSRARNQVWTTVVTYAATLATDPLTHCNRPGIKPTTLAAAPVRFLTLSATEGTPHLSFKLTPLC